MAAPLVAGQPVNLTSRANAFLDLLNDAGKPDESFVQRIPTICGKTLKKVVNNQLVFEGCEKFGPQLLGMRPILGLWTIVAEKRSVEQQKEGDAVAVKYHAVPQKGPHLECSAILHFSEGLVDDINEEYHEVPACRCVLDVRDRV